jgi:polyribonucleotide nucleotidyltransferase
MTVQTTSFTVGQKTVSFETGLLAKSATAAVVVRCDETLILVTATGSAEPRPGIDFFPLLVDFEEKMYAVGRMPGGYLKKEGRPSEKAVLTSRLIDRPIRPLWPDGYRNDVQIVANPMSMDGVNQPDVLAILGASMALTLSGLPFEGPVGAVRIGRVNGQWIVNPTYEETNAGDFDLVVAGTADSIMMVEAGADFVSEDDLIVALEMAHNEIKKQVDVQLAFAATCGVTRKPFVPPYDTQPIVDFVKQHAEAAISEAYHNFDREARQTLLADTKKAVKAAYEALAEDHPVKQLISSQPLDLLSEAFKKVEKTIMRGMVLNEGVRADGRKVTEIRPITTQVGYLPRAHGSGLFTRGSTQVLSVCTLGAPGDAQMLDGVDPATEKRWIHHYAFPGYSVGEVKPMRGAGRREIGHGALAERAIAPALPTKEQFAYTLRVNSEVLESNGSTSMASTCGASMALMNAGVPMKSAISGIAMGLIKEGDQFAVLSDIQGVEDFLGDMDFKVTGNRTGVTALQMDIKIRGISIDIMRQALAQAKEGRIHILGKMEEAIKEPSTNLSMYAPRIITMKIDTDQIGTVIGPGGKMIRSIIEQTGATIDIEDSGLVTITSVSGKGGEDARAIIEKLTKKIEIGMVVKGKVVRIIPAGAFVELIPGKDGMVHISQLVPRRVEKVDDVVKVGDDVVVKVVDIDDRGRVNLTMKGVSDEEKAPFIEEGVLVPA